MAARDVSGMPLTPGVNVDRVDIGAGLAKLAVLGYGQASHRMEVEYNLWRWKRGEEAEADRSMASSLTGVSYTGWRVVLASALAAAVGEDEERNPGYVLSEWSE